MAESTTYRALFKDGAKEEDDETFRFALQECLNDSAGDGTDADGLWAKKQQVYITIEKTLWQKPNQAFSKQTTAVTAPCFSNELIIKLGVVSITFQHIMMSRD